jgi:F0F1-type ATP synthase membrane subunit b/b'
MSLMNSFNELRRMIDDALDDVQKADGGNKAAGTRVRKKMQEIKNQAQEVRKQVLESRTDEGGDGGKGGGAASGHAGGSGMGGGH